MDTDLTKTDTIEDIGGLIAGLSDNQREYLRSRPLCKSDGECCRRLEVAETSPAMWRKRSADFKKADAFLTTAPLDVASAFFSPLLLKSVSVLEVATNPADENGKAIPMSSRIDAVKTILHNKVEFDKLKLEREKFNVRWEHAD